MIEEPWEDFKSGFVAVLGRPNVGKSTLVKARGHESLHHLAPAPDYSRPDPGGAQRPGLPGGLRGHSRLSEAP